MEGTTKTDGGGVRLGLLEMQTLLRPAKVQPT